MKWGEIIRRLRQNQDLTQQNVADMLGVDKSTIIRWEQADNIKSNTLESLARAYKITLDDMYRYHASPDILKKPENKLKTISIVVELDGTQASLNTTINRLKQINNLLATVD